MFKRFQRKPVDEPTPFVIAEPQPEMKPEDVQMCANAKCRSIGAMHEIIGGDFFLGRLDVRLCDACFQLRNEIAKRHHLSQRKTLLEHQITTPIPRTPSKPLERAYNLAEA